MTMEILGRSLGWGAKKGMNPYLLFLRRNRRYRRISGGLKTSLQAWVQIKRTSESWWNRSKIQVSWSSSWGRAVRGQHLALGDGPGEVGSSWHKSLLLSSEEGLCSITSFPPLHACQREKRCLCFLTRLCLHSQPLRASRPRSPALPPAPCGPLWRFDSSPSCKPTCRTDLTRPSWGRWRPPFSHQPRPSPKWWVLRTGSWALSFPLWQVSVPPCPQVHFSWERSF